MRITGGTLKGRQVACPPGVLRPAMDRMRESVFAVLGGLDGKSFLDLFSGSGIIALEAASRGARTVEAVEGGVEKRAVLLDNVSISPRYIRCHFMPVELFVKRTKNRSFDRIFCDPPFPYQFRLGLILSLVSSALVTEDSLILLHYPRGDFLPDSHARFAITDRREYGRSMVDFIKPILPVPAP